MGKTKTVKIHTMIKAVSPLTHNSGSHGNETIVSQEPVMYRGGVVKIPVISGNSIRHRWVREPGAMWLIDRLGIYGQATIDQLNFLFHGGALTTSGPSDNMRKIARMQTLFPLARLVGGCLPDQIVEGALICKRGILICEENMPQVEAQLPDALRGEMETMTLRPAQTFIGQYQYTRGDASRHRDAHEMLASMDDAEASQLMIYSGQTVIPGALFWHGFILQHVSILEYGALLLSLNEWERTSGTLGGQASRGHGRVDVAWMVEDEDKAWDLGEAVAAYVDHVDRHMDECRAFLEEVF